MATAMTGLSRNDGTILAQIFDPESAPSSDAVLVDSSLPSDPVIQDERIVREIKTKEKAIIQDVEAAMAAASQDVAGNLVKQRALSKASQELKALIEDYPDSASLRNDYAQVFRLQYGDNVLVSSSHSSEGNPLDKNLASEATDALLGLNKAIKLLSPATPQMAISPLQCRTLAQLHTQRGALYYAAAKELAKKHEKPAIRIQGLLEGWSTLDFEEAASRDFFMGGRYGNEIGKALAVHTNPTAKLCGQMVQEAMRRELAPTTSDL